MNKWCRITFLFVKETSTYFVLYIISNKNSRLFYKNPRKNGFCDILTL